MNWERQEAEIIGQPLHQYVNRSIVHYRWKLIFLTHRRWKWAPGLFISWFYRLQRVCLLICQRCEGRLYSLCGQWLTGGTVNNHCSVFTRRDRRDQLQERSPKPWESCTTIIWQITTRRKTQKLITNNNHGSQGANLNLCICSVIGGAYPVTWVLGKDLIAANRDPAPSIYERHLCVSSSAHRPPAPTLTEMQWQGASTLVRPFKRTILKCRPHCSGTIITDFTLTSFVK